VAVQMCVALHQSPLMGLFIRCVLQGAIFRAAPEAGCEA